MWRSGRYYTNQETPGISKHRVTRIITHERWNPFTIDEDIAVLQISPPITYSNIAQPVCFPNRDVFDGEMTLLSGYFAPISQSKMASIDHLNLIIVGLIGAHYSTVQDILVFDCIARW